MKKRNIWLMMIAVLGFTTVPGLHVTIGFSQSWLATQGDIFTTQDEAVELPENLTYENIDDILARLEDSRVRQLVIDLLEAEVERRALEKESVNEFPPSFRDKVALFGPRLRFMLSGPRSLPQDFARVLERATEGQGIGRLFSLLLWGLLFVFFGSLVEWLVRGKASDPYNRLRNPDQDAKTSRFGPVFMKVLFDLTFLMIFVIVALVPALIIFHESGPSQKLIMTLLYTIVMIRVAYLAAVFIFSPKDPGLRFSWFNDASSEFFFRWIMIFALVFIVLPEFCKIFQFLGGSEQGYLFLRVITGMIVASVLIAMALQNRKRILRAGILEGTENREEKSFFSAKNAPMLNLLFVIYVFFIWVISLFALLTGELARGKVMISLLIIPFYVILYRVCVDVLNMIIASRFSPEKKGLEEEEKDEDQIEAEIRARNVLASASKIIHVILAVAFILFISWLWGFEGPFEGRFIKAFFSVFISFLLGYLAWIYTKSAIERKLGVSDETETEEQSDEPGAGGTRDRSYTLLPLLRKFIGVVLIVTVVLFVLSSLGLQIGPLLASAGIFGLAIGLGSQALVKDVIAGIFFIVDDAFRVGDYVNIGGEQGSVVKTSLRALTLQHYKGQLQIITYGDIKSVTNWSRGPMLLKFSLRLPADTNIKKVKKIVKKVNKEMMEEEEFGPNLVEPIKSQGVSGIEDGVMRVRVKFRAMPGTQFQIKREAFRRIHAALDAAGIPFASRGVVVNVPDSLKGQGKLESKDQPSATPNGKPIDLIPGAGAAATILTDTEKKKK